MALLETLMKMDTFSFTSIFFYALVTFLIASGINLYLKRRQKVWLINQIPGPRTLPILGNALDVNVQPREFFKKIDEFTKLNKNMPMVRFWLLFVPYLLMYRAKVIEVILSSQKHIDKSRDYDFLHPWLGTGLLTSTGQKWQNRRKMLTPSFHFKILEDFVDVFNRQSETFTNNLRKRADGTPFNIFTYITLCTLDIILETAMGRTINAQDNSESEYVNAVYRLGAIVQLRQARPWLQPNILFKLFGYAKEHDACIRVLHGFSFETIRERRKERQAQKELDKMMASSDKESQEIIGKKKRLAFLDMLLEYSEETDFLSDEDIREEVDTFMFEGHDTTAAAINWSIYLFGAYPEIQEKVYEEIYSIFGDSDRPATSSDLRELKYLECCVKEALRLFPSVPFIARELREDVDIGNFKVPSGTTALISTYSLHRDPEHFPDPETFQPERFLPENAAKRHPYAYVPFSAGPRNCIGQKFAMMEEKVVLSAFLRNFRVESTTRREDLKLLGELILRPEDGMVVRIYPRK